MNSDKMEFLGNSWTNKEIDALSCIKGAYADMVSVRKGRSAVNKKKTERESDITWKTISTTAKDYYRFIQEFDRTKYRSRRTDMGDRYDPFEWPKQASRQTPLDPHVNIPEGAQSYVYPPVHSPRGTVSWYAGQTGQTLGYGSGAGEYSTATTPTVYQRGNRPLVLADGGGPSAQGGNGTPTGHGREVGSSLQHAVDPYDGGQTGSSSQHVVDPYAILKT